MSDTTYLDFIIKLDSNNINLIKPDR